jgi:hypothetical protein
MHQEVLVPCMRDKINPPFRCKVRLCSTYFNSEMVVTVLILPFLHLAQKDLSFM